ncbi:MMPL family transporter [Streptomyces mexicanus]|uniref:MMPL family transporter n=1 Tax=Streptomyces mexicanus TaxID=178566 RepID=UPI0036636A13
MCAVLSAPTFLPAVLALPDRSAYRPARPKASDTSVEGRGVWRRVAAVVDRRPRRAWALTAVVLAAFALSPAPPRRSSTGAADGRRQKNRRGVEKTRHSVDSKT